MGLSAKESEGVFGVGCTSGAAVAADVVDAVAVTVDAAVVIGAADAAVTV